MAPPSTCRSGRADPLVATRVGDDRPAAVKVLVPALTRALAHDDREVSEGEIASALLTRYRFEPGTFEGRERVDLRRDLPAYRVRDTFVMVALLGRLQQLTGQEGQGSWHCRIGLERPGAPIRRGQAHELGDVRLAEGAGWCPPACKAIMGCVGLHGSGTMRGPTSCPQCGATVTAGERTCSSCGATLASVMPVSAEVSNTGTATESGLEAELQEALQPTYLLVKLLGTGGMGSVFLAREPALRRSVAVKVLSAALAADPNARARFEREAQAVARMAHPNVVAIHGLGELREGRPYFVMQYVDGPSLSERAETEGPLGVEESRRLVGEVASALAAAHARGIIHRDVKPANVLYDRESGRALVTDFGIAAVRPTEQTAAPLAKLTGTGLSLGTPQYMSPEQLLAEPVTERTDVYGLGLVAYELLTGRAPFTATTPQELIAAHLRDTPIPITKLRPDVDPELAALITRCLAKQAEERPTAAEVAQRLLPGAGTLLEWPPPGVDALRGALERHARRLWGGSLAVAVALLAYVTFGAAAPGGGAPTAPLQIAGLVLAFLGSIALVLAVIGLVRAVRQAAAMVREGFTWLTVGEAAADTRGDTGALIAGAKEYAGLEPFHRSALRVARVRRGLLTLASAILPCPMLIVAAWLGAAGVVGPAALPWLVFGPSLIGLAAALWLGRREHAAVAASRRQLIDRRRAPAEVGRLVEPWYASFEAVRRGQPVGRGAPDRSGLGWSGGLIVGAVIIGTVLSLVPVWFFSYLGSTLTGTLQVSSVLEKVMLAAPVRVLALPPDSSITPLQAGSAFWALQGDRSHSSAFPEHPAPTELPALPVPGDSLFVGLRHPGWAGPGDSVIVVAARGRLTRAERAYLTDLAASPVWDAYAIVARAPAMDYLGARYVVPFSPQATPWNMPIPNVQPLRVLAYANAARAAHYVASGRPAEAERVLRETISIGSRVMDGVTLMDMLIGVVILSIGRRSLIEFYDVMGQPEGRALAARVDSVRAALETDPVAGVQLRAGTAERTAPASMLVIAQDAAAPRGLRIEAGLMPLALAPCTNARELLFGPSPSTDSAFAGARRTLVRYPSDAAVLDLIQGAVVREVSVKETRRGSRPGLVDGVILAATRAGGVVLRNPRLGGCGRIVVRAGVDR